MKSKKKQKPSWLEVKAALAHLNQQGLLELISDMYNLSKYNGDFLHTCFSIGDVDEYVLPQGHDLRRRPAITNANLSRM